MTRKRIAHIAQSYLPSSKSRESEFTLTTLKHLPTQCREHLRFQKWVIAKHGTHARHARLLRMRKKLQRT